MRQKACREGVCRELARGIRVTGAACDDRDPAARSPWYFFALVVGLSMPFWLAGWITGWNILPGLPVSAMMAVCPLVAALILARRADGGPGVGRVLRHALRAPRGWRWAWLPAALLLFPVLLVVSSAIVPAPPASFPALGALPMVLAFVAAAMAEEVGWAGYATDPMQARLGALGAALAIGGVWAAWHIVPYLEVDRSWSWIAWQSLFSIAARVILVWLYANTQRSVVVSALGHASINVAVFLLPQDSMAYDPRAAALSAVVAAMAVAVAWGPRTLTQSRARL